MYVILYVRISSTTMFLVDSASELLVSLSSGNLEDFYPSAAIASLMKILKDPSLSQHHTMVIQVVNLTISWSMYMVVVHVVKYGGILYIGYVVRIDMKNFGFPLLKSPYVQSLCHVYLKN